MLRTDLPYVDFVFDERLPETLINRLSEKYGDWSEARSPRHLSVIPPKEYTDWAMSQYRPGVGALAYSLLTEEICQHLQALQVEQIKVVGTQYNAFAEESFTSKRWFQAVPVAVGKLTREPDDPDYHRYHNLPAIEINGQILGTFATESPINAKLNLSFATPDLCPSSKTPFGVMLSSHPVTSTVMSRPWKPIATCGKCCC